ncbi:MULTISPECIES: hypothetical protein [Bradyrhizobium]|uniref:RiboL-PSP-HEPN domain-containing protein n=2 Tax=Bradyrhizobium TaxID=374 RepID=A0ABY0QFA5_9BRAD|nr:MULTISPECIES: hypothetical protein [Bradyrhizobium]SDK15008.1 hypothetical protein SAMN05444163_7364 [Bradyrhizobium ottawaense]SEE50441.1 hypothetical protein SAMN05444171_7767 [Bradyrhizobium lablabi]
MASRSSRAPLKTPSRRRRLSPNALEEVKQAHRDYVAGTLVPKKFLKPLGYLMVWAATFEHAIDQAIYTFFSFDHPDKGSIISARFSTLGTKLDVLKVIAELSVKNPAAKSAFNKIMSDADKFIGERNKLTHGDWKGASGDDSALKITYKAQGKLTVSHKWYYVEEVMAIAESGLGLSDRLWAFFRDHPDWNVSPP